jgi:hypothetical protein
VGQRSPEVAGAGSSPGAASMAAGAGEARRGGVVFGGGERRGPTGKCASFLIRDTRACYTSFLPLTVGFFIGF